MRLKGVLLLRGEEEPIPWSHLSWFRSNEKREATLEALHRNLPRSVVSWDLLSLREELPQHLHGIGASESEGRRVRQIFSKVEEVKKFSGLAVL